jgi:hypothetical protein
MIARKVFCVEFSFNELVSLMIIFVMTKHPAAIILEYILKVTTSNTGDCPTCHHHSPSLCASAEGTAYKENEYSRLHYDMTTEDIGDLSVRW